MNQTGYITTADGVRLFFQMLGNGPKTVVIPNGIYLLDDFSCLADDCTLIAYDLRNRGLPIGPLMATATFVVMSTIWKPSVFILESTGLI